MEDLKAGTLLYDLCTLKTEIEVDCNLPFKVPALKLVWAKGMVGALPVFLKREDAEKFAPGHEILLFRVGRHN